MNLGEDKYRLQDDIDGILAQHAVEHDLSSQCIKIGDHTGALRHLEEAKSLSEVLALLEGRKAQLMWPDHCTGGAVALGPSFRQRVPMCI